MSYASIDDLRSHLGPRTATDDPEYAKKMLHPMPPVKIADREGFILQHCTGKRVLEFGASGPLSAKIKAAAAEYLGVDRTAGDRVVAFDIDDVWQRALPDVQPIDLIVCGEVIEHLSNPGWFLTRLKGQYCGVPLIVTVPNAFSEVSLKWVARGKENCNADHVAWYSPHTLQVLLERAGYTVGDLYYYGGTDCLAEGLLVATE